jgi:hypothetical protein
MRRLLHSVVLLLFVCSAFAQLPESDIWIFALKEKKGQISLGAGKNLTARPGYENQPAFMPGGSKILYAAAVGKQTDVFLQGVSSKKPVAVVSTFESQYSPRPVNDAKQVQCVVVETDSSQKIHTYDLKKGTLVSKLEIDSVGYFTYINDDTLVFFKLTAPHSIRYTTATSRDEQVLGVNPCRTILRVNRHAVMYALKDSATTSFFIYDFVLRKAGRIAMCSGPAEDFVLHPTLGLLRSSGPNILVLKKETNTWEPLFEFAGFGIAKVTRFVFSPDGKRLAVVNQP